MFLIVLNPQVGIDFEFLHVPTYTNFLAEVMFMASLAGLWKPHWAGESEDRGELSFSSFLLPPLSSWLSFFPANHEVVMSYTEEGFSR